MSYPTWMSLEIHQQRPKNDYSNSQTNIAGAGALPEDPIAASRYIMQHKVDFQAKYIIVFLVWNLREGTRKKLPFLYALVPQFAVVRLNFESLTFSALVKKTHIQRLSNSASQSFGA